MVGQNNIINNTAQNGTTTAPTTPVTPPSLECNGVSLKQVENGVELSPGPPPPSSCQKSRNGHQEGSDNNCCLAVNSEGGGCRNRRRSSVSAANNIAYQSLTEKIQGRVESGEPFFSLEFFPPRTKSGAVNLLARLDRFRHGGPLFVDVTWHPAGNPGGDSETSSMTIACASLNYSGMDTILHMTCAEASIQDINRHLAKAKDQGIRNILALRGDRNEDSGPADFQYGTQLVKHIREHYGDYFVIGVAGYPTGHPEADSYEDDLRYLKEKVDAGADFIITQLFFKTEVYIKFVEDCRRIGIRVPIIPGVMPIQSYDSLRHIVKLSKLEVPKEILDIVEPLRNNDEAIRNFGVHQAVEMIKSLFQSGMAPGVHFYTLNREVAVMAITKQLGLWNAQPQRPLPWKVVPSYRRCGEEIRPIFWSARPNAYIYRTRHWDDFPNGRWGSAESPAFGQLKDYYLFYLKCRSTKEELVEMWGPALETEQDVWDVFYYYLSGKPNDHGVKVSKIPWNEEELSLETNEIREKLAMINKRGVLTINSQPNINGVPSTDPIHGWGQPGGYVYKKAYLEFFTCGKNVQKLKGILARYPQINYHIINKNGRYNYTNAHRHCPIAVSWGVFPGREILQPTVVDSESFLVWKDEAFTLWNVQWAKLYPDDSKSREIIDKISESYYLVNLVDNDYPKDTVLWDVINEMLEEDNSSSGGSRAMSECSEAAYSVSESEDEMTMHFNQMAM